MGYWFGGPTFVGPPIVLDGLAFESIEVNLGDEPKHDGYFTIVTSGKIPGKPVLVIKAVGPYFGKSGLDETEMDMVSAQRMGHFWHSASLLQGYMKFNYLVSS